MKKIIATFITVAILSATTLFGSAYAFGDKTGLEETFNQVIETQQEDTNFLTRFAQRQGVRRILNRIADRLKLTEEQKAEIREIIQNEIPVIQPILVSGLAVRQQLKELGKDGVYNQQEVMRLATLQATNAKLLIIEKEKTEARIFAVLTPEQRAEAEALRDEIEARIRERISQGTDQKF